MIKVNGKEIHPRMDKGYAVVKRAWSPNDKVTVEFPMDVHILKADDRVEDDHEKMAIQRGPVVYCAEWPDTPGGHVLNLVFNLNEKMDAEYEPGLLNGIETISTIATPAIRTLQNEIYFSKSCS